MPHFGKMRLDAITHERVSAWFDAASAEKPGAANRAFDILRAMLVAARQWGELGEHVPDACANIVKNPRRPVARFLDRDELERLGKVLDSHQAEHPWHVAVIRLLTLTGARLSEVLHLKWDEVRRTRRGTVRAPGSKTPRPGRAPVWLGPEAAGLLAALPRPGGRERVFPGDLTSQRLYTFWRGIREEAGLPGLRIHDCRHTWASQGVMNGVGLTTVGRMLGHRNRETTAIYAHLDDTALRDAAVQAASVIARAMNYEAEPPLVPEEEAKDAPASSSKFVGSSGLDSLDWQGTPLRLGIGSRSAETTQPEPGRVARPRPQTVDVAGRPADSDSDDTCEDGHEHRGRELLWL